MTLHAISNGSEICCTCIKLGRIAKSTMPPHCSYLTVLLLITASYKSVSTSNVSCDCHGTNGEAQKTIYIAFMTAFNGSFVSSGTIPAVDLAIERINNDSTLLQKYKIDYTMAIDTEVRSIYMYHATVILL